MLAVIRIVLVLMLSISICVIGIFICLLRPRTSYYSSIFGRFFGYMSCVFGIKVEVRNLINDGKLPRHCVYISNHQSNYDLITATCAVPPRTITIGKKSLLWVPLFGQLYWLSGNILINRKKKIRRVYSVLDKVAKNIRRNNMSIWIFPEGTRNFGKSLLPFKTGAFRIAIAAKVPIVIVCISNIIANNKINLNRWNNGLVIVEVAFIIETYKYELHDTRYLADFCYNFMKNKLEVLNKEVIFREMSTT